MRIKDNPGNTGDWSDLVTTVDTDAPHISGFNISPLAFSPNDDGVLDVIAVSATISDVNPVTWEICVRCDVTGPLVVTTSGSGETIAWPWDGSGEQGDDDHTVVLPATDSIRLWTIANGSVVDTASPSYATLR